MGMTWAAYWNALMENHALLGAGLGLLIVGATFRWFEPLNEFLERAASWMMFREPEIRHPDSSVPGIATRKYAARLRAAGDEAGARRAEERAEDHRRRLIRYGRAMMVVGVVLFLLSVLLL
jgi:hypothetical protein